MGKDKIDFFEASTQSLLRKLDAMKMDKMSRIRAKNFARAIRDSMLNPDVQIQTFNLRSHQCNVGYDSVGFCRVASLSFMNLMSEKNTITQDWDLFVVNGRDTDHHFLQHRLDGAIFDLTFDQFSYNGIVVPYKCAHRTFVGVIDKDPLYDFYNACGFDKFKPLDLPLIGFKDR